MPVLTLHYRPHLTSCDERFTFTPKVMDVTKASACLILYQLFLGLKNHSQLPYKSRIDFFTGSDLAKDNNQIVYSTNNHYMMPPESESALTVDEMIEHINSITQRRNLNLRISYYPNIPCDPFIIPVSSEEEASEAINMLIAYDDYLLNTCSGMRVDYCNTCVLEILEGQEWLVWEKETEDGSYFDNVDEYLEFKSATA